ncbi:MAG: glycosyltransferase family 1 protein [Actinomycetota bacterium]|nr:glycosyltransferase family 1 protein [Actinomycetota bacterium]
MTDDTRRSTGMLSVAFDSEIFVRQQRGGISRYFAELIGEYTRHEDLGIRASLLFSRSSNQHLRESVPSLTAQMPALRAVPRGVPRMLHLGDAFKDAFVNYRASSDQGGHGFDWVHATYFRPKRVDVARGQRLAVTLYDMTPELLGVDMQHGPHRGKHETLARADLILSISQASADQLAALMPAAASKTVVVPLGVSDVFLQAAPQEAAVVDFPYLLFVGSRLPYKRFDLLLAALAQLRGHGLDLGLVIAGEPLSEIEVRQVAQQLPTDRFAEFTPSDPKLAGLYSHASAFVFPSEMEGFGLPLLEAMACNCPVIASAIPVFHEVAGAAAHYFEPGNSEHLAEVIVEVLSNDDARVQLQSLGRQLALQSTWHATALATANAYRAFN